MRENVKAVLEERKLQELQQRFVDHMKSGGQPSLSLMLSKSNKKRMKVFSVQRQGNASQSVKSFVSTQNNRQSSAMLVHDMSNLKQSRNPKNIGLNIDSQNPVQYSSVGQVTPL